LGESIGLSGEKTAPIFMWIECQEIRLFHQSKFRGRQILN